MVSEQLARLRETARKQTAVYKAYGTQSKQLKEQGYATIDRRGTAKREDLLEHARNSYHQAMQDAYDDAKTIRERAAKRKTPSTPEARAKIEKMLSNGWTLQDACQQLVAENDRAAMTALHEYLPYAARAQQLPIPHQTSDKDYDRIISHAKERIGLFEPKMWDKQEAQAHAEAREVEISLGMIESNHNKLIEHLDRQAVSPIHPGVRNIFRWQGLPDDTSVEKGYEVLEETPHQVGSITMR